MWRLPGKRQLLMDALEVTGGNRLLRLSNPWTGLLVLNYHRIGTADGSLFDWDLWSASENAFEQQVKFLKQNFDLIGIDDLPHVYRRQVMSQGRNERFVMITFDDGYRDNYELAYPILKRHNATATFFLATGFLDQPRVPWWDEIAWVVQMSHQNGIPENDWTSDAVEFDEPSRKNAITRLLRVYKAMPGDENEAYLGFLADATGSGRCPIEQANDLWMNWDMVAEMRNGGMCFGAHTVNHPVLSSLSADEQEIEIYESKLRIEHELSEEVTSLSYPVGSQDAFNTTTREILAKHGIRWAFTFHGGYSRFNELDALAIPRIAIESYVNKAAFRSTVVLPQVFA